MDLRTWYYRQRRAQVVRDLDAAAHKTFLKILVGVVLGLTAMVAMLMALSARQEPCPPAPDQDMICAPVRGK